MVEMVQRSTLRWLGHLEGMGRDELTRRIYINAINTVDVVGRKTPDESGGHILEYLKNGVAEE